MTAVVLVYLAFSIVPSIFSTQGMTVTPAEAIKHSEVLPVRGIVLRDEVLITASGNPSSIDYKVLDGDRVSIGDEVAVYSTTPISATDRLSVESIDRQIELLNESLSTTTQFDLNALETRTKEAISQYLSASSGNDLSVIRDSTTDVLSYMIKKDIKSGGDKDYYETILENCTATRESILSGNARQTSVYSSQAGYFTSQYDGYEHLTQEKILDAKNEITPAYVRELLSGEAQPRPADYVGKLQHFSFWNYVCVISEEDAEANNIKPDSKKPHTLRFNTATYGSFTVEMTVKQVSKSYDDSVAVVFECSFFDQAIYSLRICDAEIVLNTHDGFRVNKDSIRVSDGQSGVYVLSGEKLVFKPVQILYLSEGSNFAVVSPATQDSAKKLYLHDSVVVGGKEIEDGKVVNIN